MEFSAGNIAIIAIIATYYGYQIRLAVWDYVLIRVFVQHTYDEI